MHRRACEEEEKSAGPQPDAARIHIVISRLVEVVYVKADSPDAEPITEKLARLQALLAEDRAHNARAVLELTEGKQQSAVPSVPSWSAVTDSCATVYPLERVSPKMPAQEGTEPGYHGFWKLLADDDDEQTEGVEEVDTSAAQTACDMAVANPLSSYPPPLGLEAAEEKSGGERLPLELEAASTSNADFEKDRVHEEELGKERPPPGLEAASTVPFHVDAQLRKEVDTSAAQTACDLAVSNADFAQDRVHEEELGEERPPPELEAASTAPCHVDDQLSSSASDASPSSRAEGEGASVDKTLTPRKYAALINETWEAAIAQAKRRPRQKQKQKRRSCVVKREDQSASGLTLEPKPDGPLCAAQADRVIGPLAVQHPEVQAPRRLECSGSDAQQQELTVLGADSLAAKLKLDETPSAAQSDRVIEGSVVQRTKAQDSIRSECSGLDAQQEALTASSGPDSQRTKMDNHSAAGHSGDSGTDGLRSASHRGDGSNARPPDAVPAPECTLTREPTGGYGPDSQCSEPCEYSTVNSDCCEVDVKPFTKRRPRQRRRRVKPEKDATQPPDEPLCTGQSDPAREHLAVQHPEVQNSFRPECSGPGGQQAKHAVSSGTESQCSGNSGTDSQRLEEDISGYIAQITSMGFSESQARTWISKYR